MFKIWSLIGIIAILIGGSLYLFRLKAKKQTKNSRSRQKNHVLNHAPRDLRTEIQYMDHLNGYQFEDYTAWLLSLNGFTQIKQTGKNNDNGLDVIATHNQITYGIQCKHYKKRRIPRRVIKHTADGAHFYGTQRAVVLTNTRFSREAVRSRKFFNVELWDRETLIQFIKQAIFNYHHQNQ